VQSFSHFFGTDAVAQVELYIIDVGLKGGGIRRIYEYFDQQLRCEYRQ